MREHAIPQAVTSYEFHLIGNMTLKQFLELAAGFVLAFLVYSTNLPGVIKWPIVLLLAGMGAMLAFVPFEGRPLDQWFIALVRAIYKPTEFYWRKTAHIPDYFTFSSSNTRQYEQEFDFTPIKQRRIKEFISTVPQERHFDPLSADEYHKLSSVLSLFDEVIVQDTQIVQQFVKPSIVDTSTHTLQPINRVFPTVNSTQSLSIDANTQAGVHQILVPVDQPPLIQPAVAANPQDQEATISSQTEVQVFSTAASKSLIPTDVTQAQTSSTLPFPKRPTQANIVVGMIFTEDDAIVENAIIEIVDNQGLPVRAVRTNAIGQFSISTPLSNGSYYLRIEKEGLVFATIQLTLQNTILDPLLIRAQSIA